MSNISYGVPLPPGLEAITKGELRIRVEKMILDDSTLNHNPLVTFSGADGKNLVSSGSSHTGGANRFVVPVDHCAVSPLFWGEVQPSTQCQPTTPQQQRGVHTLVYPIKVGESVFSEYMQNMTRSPHHGLHLEVFVPASYSGRPAVPVGKCIISLDHLQPKKSISSWFTVAHSQVSLGRNNSAPLSRNSEEATDESQSDVVLIPVGKIKLHFQLNFFSQGAKKRDVWSKAKQTSSTDERKNLETSAQSVSDGPSESDAVSTSANISHVLEEREAIQQENKNDRSTNSNSYRSPASARKTPAPGDSRPKDSPAMVDAEPKIAFMAPPLASPPHVSVVDNLLQKGNQLRLDMMRAVAEGPASGTPPPIALNEPPSLPPALQSHAKPADVLPSDLIRTPPVHTTHAGSTDSLSETSAYTSELSDDERFTVQLQNESEGWRSRGVASHARQDQRHALNAGDAANDKAPRALRYTTEVIPCVNRRGGNRAALGFNTMVELIFSDISFPSTFMTADLEELRINVRLSTDVTTDEPTAGPFSSFVHQLPLSQTAVHLSFSVRSFSEETSRLVVEFFKVKTRPKSGLTESRSWQMPPTTTREVVSETLMGLCIVGLFEQSREVVLHDPVHNMNNAYGNLIICLTSQSTDSRGARLDSDAQHHSHKVRTQKRVPKDEVMTEASDFTSRADTYQRKRVDGIAPERALPNAGSDAAVHTPDRGLPARSPTRTPPRNPTAPNTKLHKGAVARTAAAGGNREKILVCIVSAAQIPKVAVRTQCSRPNNSDSPATRVVPEESLNISHKKGHSSEEVVAFDGLEYRFKPPNTFFIVEELFAALTSRSAAVAPIADWYIESAGGGNGDRTHVVYCSQSPTFNYECAIDAARVRDDLVSAENDNGVNSSLKSSAASASLSSSLREVTVSLWHHVTEDEPAYVQQKPGQGEDDHFWENAALIGICRADLRPLRFLKRLNGYYRIDPPSSDSRVVANTRGPKASGSSSSSMGYVHLCISQL